MSRIIRTSRTARAGVLLALLAAAFAFPPSASAARPQKISFSVNFNYSSEDLTELCGFDVDFSLVGLFKGMLFRNKSGVIVGEFDSQPNTTISFSAPDSGRTVSYKFSTRFHNRYPDGTDPGDRVLTWVTGFGENVPGLPASAGRTYFPNGVVLFVDDDGVPIDDYGEPSTEVGHHNDGADTDAAICAALAP